MFKTPSEPSPASTPLIAANTTLEQDKATVLRCWLAMGGNDDTLRRKRHEHAYNMRDEPSDDVSEWWGVTVEGGRVTKNIWSGRGLSCTIPSEIGALSALWLLSLCNNELGGSIPPTTQALTNFTVLNLCHNPLSAVAPSTLSNLTNLS